MQRITTVLLSSALALLIGWTAHGDAILAWDMEGDHSPTNLPADSVINPNLQVGTGTNTLFRFGLGVASANNGFNSNGWNISDTFKEHTNYIYFIVAPKPGYEMTLTDLRYAMWGSNTGPRNGRWGYRIGSGSFVLQDPFTNLLSTTTLATWDFPDFTTDQAVEFRYWAWGTLGIRPGNNSSSGGTVRIGNIAGDDLVLSGAVIPEPSALPLIGIGLLGMWVFARRRFAR